MREARLDHPYAVLVEVARGTVAVDGGGSAASCWSRLFGELPLPADVSRLILTGMRSPGRAGRGRGGGVDLTDRPAVTLDPVADIASNPSLR